jgi:hypothetical protein
MAQVTLAIRKIRKPPPLVVHSNISPWWRSMSEEAWLRAKRPILDQGMTLPGRIEIAGWGAKAAVGRLVHCCSCQVVNRTRVYTSGSSNFIRTTVEQKQQKPTASARLVINLLASQVL